MYQINNISILLFTSFLLLFFSILLNLIRLMTTESYNGTAQWTGAFLLPMLIVFHIFNNIYKPDNISFIFITIIFLLSNIMLYRGWRSFYQDKGRINFYLTAVLIFSAAALFSYFTSYNSEIVIDTANIFILLSLIIYLYKKYKNRHSYSSKIILVLNTTALLMRLLPFLTDIMQKKTLSYYHELQVLEMLSFPVHISLLMLAIYLAIMHKLRIDYTEIISEKEQLLEQLEHLSITDPLTDIYNRRGFEKVISYEFLQNRRRDNGFIITICDIDFFKKINDTHGHECGDIVIKKTAEIIKNCIRVQDTVARWGGEEFIILMLNCSLEQAAVSVERIRSEIENQKIDYNNNTVQLTMSFGISESRKEDKDFDRIIARSDQKLYRAKESGRNCIVC